MIEVIGISKAFTQNVSSAGVLRTLLGRVPSRSVTALDNLNFAVEEGRFYSLLGRNGAGKTTAIKILCTLLLPDSGFATVAGYDAERDATEVRRNIGVSIRGERSVYWRLSGRQNLEYFGRLYDITGADLQKRVGEIESIIGLEGRLDDYVERYSMGMKQRLAIGCALIHKPKVLLLDEPTIGLDAAGARSLRRFISRELRDRENVTILYTTHYMHEAEEMSDVVGILHDGQIVAEGTPTEVAAMVDQDVALEVDASGVEPEMIEELRNLSNVSSISTNELGHGHTKLRILASDDSPPVDAIVTALTNLGARIESLETVKPSLEDAFVALTGGDPEN